MTAGLKKGDRVRVIDTEEHGFPLGTEVTFLHKNGGYYDFTNDDGIQQLLDPHQFELIEEEDTMAEKRKVSGGRERNPKNFRNGDVIKVTTRTDQDSMVFVKFGENYYNLTAGGQMKACRYLPPGTKEIITNLSGMGKFFLMSEEELEKQASRPSGGSTIGTNPVTDFEYIMKTADSIQWDNTTEEK